MSPQSPALKPTSYRWVICALLFWVTTANYIDRGVLSNLSPEMGGRLHIEQKDWDAAYWNMNVVFQGAYAISLLFMGRLMDVLGLRWGFVLACAFWGIASALHAIAPEIGALFGSTIAGFFVCRILLGLGEGGNFPAAIKTVAEWFPKRERALATGLFNCGSNVGSIVVPRVLPWILAFNVGSIALGWRGAFILTATIDLLWIIAWLTLYKKPENHPRVNKAELALIRGDAIEPTVKIPWSRLFPHRQMWAVAVAKGMTDCFFWFYLFSTPDLFNKKFHLDPDGRKYLIMLIYVVASVGSVAGGWLAGAFMKQGWTTNKARKITLLICAAFVMPVAFAAITDSKWLAAVLITLAASGHQAWSANAFSLAGDMFPKRVVGSVIGLAGMVGAIGGMALFFLTGIVLTRTGSYLPIFVMASLAYAVALLIVHILVPNLELAQIEAA
ncbi:MAG TPA: MFS transporter [Opitutaceae bacterium]|jgi:ACS family hexuronate transporter-like MFS transporter|nr:MFS transporter [Opitutaceae bacterium]